MSGERYIGNGNSGNTDPQLPGEKVAEGFNLITNLLSSLFPWLSTIENSETGTLSQSSGSGGIPFEGLAMCNIFLYSTQYKYSAGYVCTATGGMITYQSIGKFAFRSATRGLNAIGFLAPIAHEAYMAGTFWDYRVAHATMTGTFALGGSVAGAYIGGLAGGWGAPVGAISFSTGGSLLGDFIADSIWGDLR